VAYRVARSRRARQDVRGIADQLAQTSSRTALRFLDATEAAYTRLAHAPGLGGPYESAPPHLAGLRIWPVTGFKNYLIIYQVGADEIEIVRVLHGARDLDALLPPES
jgi:toxin ParE1/3/4